MKVTTVKGTGQRSSHDRFGAIVDRAGAVRDLDWVSIDPLVPRGSDASSSVLGVMVPASLIERGRHEGVFGVIGRLSYRGGRRIAELLGGRTPRRGLARVVGTVRAPRFVLRHAIHCRLSNLAQ